MRLRIDAPVGYDFTWRGLLSYVARLPAILRRLRGMIARYDVRIVNAHYPTTAVVGFLLLRKLGLFDGRVILSFHGTDIRRAREATGLVRAIWRWMLREADEVVAVSAALRDVVEALKASRKGPACTVIHNGVDPELVVADAARVAAPEPRAGRTFLLNVGTYDHVKAQDVLVRAFARIADEFPDIDLVIIGKDGAARPMLAAMIAELGLASRVRCLVDLPHAQVLAWMRCCLLFVLPSRAEGLPITILEAGALGVPVIASEVGGNAEIVAPNATGLLVPAEDPGAIVDAVRLLVQDANLRLRLAAQLHARVLQEFSWARAWQEYLRLVGDGRRRRWRVAPRSRRGPDATIRRAWSAVRRRSSPARSILHRARRSRGRSVADRRLRSPCVIWKCSRFSP